VAVVHRTHTSCFCSALQQLSHSVALLSLSAAASSILGIWCLYPPLSSVKPRGSTELPTGERREDVGHRFVQHLDLPATGGRLQRDMDLTTVKPPMYARVGDVAITPEFSVRGPASP
jgi:hypothetical protein